MTKTRTAILLFLTLTMAVIAAPAPAEAEIVNRIVAMVNGEVITLKDLEAKVNALKDTPDLESMGLGKPNSPEFKRKVLDFLINEKLVMQQATKRGLHVSDEQVMYNLEQYKKMKNISQEQLLADLQKERKSLDQFKEEIRTGILRNELMKEDIQGGILVPDEEVDAFVRSHTDGGGAAPQPTGAPLDPEADPTPLPGRVHTRSIVFNLPQTKDPAAIEKLRERIGKVYLALQGGMEFTEAVDQFSDAPGADNTGDKGWIEWEYVHPRIRAVLQQIPVGLYSPPLQTGPAVEIFKIVEMDPAGQEAQTKRFGNRKAAETNGPSISSEDRERVRQLLTQQRLGEKYSQWIEHLREQAIIDVKL